MKKSLWLIPFVIALSACSDSEDEAIEKAVNEPQKSAEQLYNDARALVDEDKNRDAIKAFDEVERQHPASPLAVDSQVMSAYSAYKVEEYDQAVATLERFVKMYPTSDSAPYAYYLIALCYYEQISDVARDQKITQSAQAALRDVVRRYPDTDYARDAKIKLDLTEDHLAGKEMQVGRYYLSRGDTLAAINRFRYVVENYQTTSHVPEALHRLVETYLALGIREEAQRYASVLGYNFPDSIWYRDSYKLLNGEVTLADQSKAGTLALEGKARKEEGERAKEEPAKEPEPAKEQQPATGPLTPPITAEPAKEEPVKEPEPAATEQPAAQEEESSSWWPF